MDGPIRIFVGTCDGMEKSDLALHWSVHKHSTLPYEITFMHAHKEGTPWQGWSIGRGPLEPYSKGWATDFTCFRWAIPEAAGFEGRGIYVDTDMVFLKDPAELWNTEMTHPCMAVPRADVILFNCADPFWSGECWPDLDKMRRSGWMVPRYKKLVKEHSALGPLSPKWNCMDGRGMSQETCLYHWTDMRRQPWKPFPGRFRYPDHPNADLFWQYYEEAKENMEALQRA